MVIMYSMMLVINSDTIKLCIIIFLIVILFSASCSKMNSEVKSEPLNDDTERYSLHIHATSF